MSDPKNPVPGDQIIDASDLTLIDITPEQVNKFVKVREGVSQAIAAIVRLDPEQIERAGLNASDIARLGTVKAQYDRIEAILPATEKLVEMLTETRAANGHEIATLLGEIASQSRRRAQHDPNGAEILGPLADLLTYQYGPAKKGAATRAKANQKDNSPTE